MVSWLEAKGFSRTAQKQLRVSGHQLFALSRAQLERVLGTDEGKRLYSQVLVQRNISGVRCLLAFSRLSLELCLECKIKYLSKLRMVLLESSCFDLVVRLKIFICCNCQLQLSVVSQKSNPERCSILRGLRIKCYLLTLTNVLIQTLMKK